ncbi:MAG: hypothetical protein Aurels2KO_06960 [Aureliella sp.]
MRPALLLSQQIDQLASLYLSSQPTNEPLSKADRQAVSTWLLFDTEFAKSVEGDSQLRFERAVALRRVGFANMLLGDIDAAIEALNPALDVLDQLREEEPTNISLSVEGAGGYSQLAQLYHRQGNREQATLSCDRAFALLQSELHGMSQEWDDEVKRPLAQLARLYSSLGSSIDAAKVASANREVLERLLQERGDSPEDMALLKASLQIINAANADQS